ncbi:MAG TPA: membrane protein insertase YidC [bacterium]|nr:membrane protein insertase YidC [bacterium]
MDNNTRLVLFLISCMAVLAIGQFFMPQPSPSAAHPGSATPSAGQTTGHSSTQAVLSTSATAEKGSFQKTSPKAVDVPARSVTVETDLYTAVFSNEGAVLTSFELKKYPNRLTKKPVDLVNNDPARPKPFSVVYGNGDWNKVRFQVEGGEGKLSKGSEPSRLVFRGRDASGAVLTKTFSFKDGSYLVGLDIAADQAGSQALAAGPLAIQWADNMGTEEATGTNSRTTGLRVTTLTGNRIDSQNAKKSKESVEIAGPVEWTALANQFFMGALIPDPSSGSASVKVVREFNAYKLPTPDDPHPGLDPSLYDPRPQLIFNAPALSKGQGFHVKLQAFIGPQEYELLKSLNLHLEGVIDFGTFGFISVYMLKLLKWFYTIGHNWGLAIIFLSVVVKLVLWLPTHNSYKSMAMTSRKMKEVQPKIDALKRKYPDDKQKQQQEQMRIFQEAGINPLGGCLPMLFQIPIFWALYATLGHCIELRGASFLWLHDLTLKDPFFVFSLLMGGTMIIQQKVSGQMATQAAGQQKMLMWMMPVVLTFVSKDWPSGLLVYWVVTNVLSMIQQKVVNREIQRALKKEEGGKA